MLSEYQYRPARTEEIPQGDFALEQARRASGSPVLHNHGALRCLEELSGLLADGGVILINDYGQSKEESAEDFEHQRFSLATFVGVNFPLLGRYFSGREGLTWAEPSKFTTSQREDRWLIASREEGSVCVLSVPVALLRLKNDGPIASPFLLLSHYLTICHSPTL